MLFDKEIIIKRKITFGDIIVLGFLFIISFFCIYGFFYSDSDENIIVLLIGLIFGLLFISIFLYCTFKRPYFKVNSKGVYVKVPKGFSYGKEKLYSWNEILDELNQDITDENELVELKDEFIENYIKLLKQRMSKIDKYLGGRTIIDKILYLKEIICKKI